MGFVLEGLGGICYLISFVCSIIILIDAFKNEVWKGIVGLLCGLYLLYYAIVEFQNPNKWAILAGSLLGGVAGGVLFMMGTAMQLHGIHQ